MTDPISIDSFGARAFGVSVSIGRPWDANAGRMNEARVSLNLIKPGQSINVDGDPAEMAAALRMLASVVERFGGKP